MIKWDTKYIVGVEEIDKQHQKLFEIGNRVYEILKDELIIDKYDKAIEIIEELKEYAKYHFTYEENYMKEIKHKELFSHVVDHQRFIEKLNEIDLDEIDNHQDKYLMDLLNFIIVWIANHILGKDMKYSKLYY